MRRVWVGLAVFVLAAFLGLHALGARDAVSLLSGTPTADPVVGGGGGLVYVLSWFGVTLLAPVLVIASVLDGWLVARQRASRGFEEHAVRESATR